MKALQVKMDQDVYKQLRHAAVDADTNVSDLIRGLIDEFLKANA